MNSSKHLFVIVCIIIGAGVFGGFGAFLDSYTPNSNDKYEVSIIAICTSFEALKFVFIGLVAASIVPLFLNIISSNLIDFSDEGQRHRNYMIFTSLCIVAAFFSSNFIEATADKLSLNTLGKRVSGLEIQGVESRIKLDAVADKAAESIEKSDVALAIQVEGDNNNSVGLDELVNRLSEKFSLSIKQRHLLETLGKEQLMYQDELLKKIDATDIAVIDDLIDKQLIRCLDIQGKKIVHIAAAP